MESSTPPQGGSSSSHMGSLYPHPVFFSQQSSSPYNNNNNNNNGMYPSLGYPHPYYYTSGPISAAAVQVVEQQSRSVPMTTIPQVDDHQPANNVVPMTGTIPLLHQVQQPSQEEQVPTTATSTTTTGTRNQPTRGGCGCFFWKRNDFNRSLQTKSVSCIPRAVAVLGVLLFILTFIFLSTVGNSIDKKRAYKKDQCVIIKDPDNLVVHFDYDRDMYYINLNVDLARNGKYYMGSCNSCGAGDKHPNNVNQQQSSSPKPTNGATAPVRKMYTLREVCASSLSQKTSDCRDRLIAKGSLTCMVNRRLAHRSGRMGTYYHGNRHGSENKAPGNHKGARPQMMHHRHHNHRHHGMMTRELRAPSGHHHGPHRMTREIPLAQILSKQEHDHPKEQEKRPDGNHNDDCYGNERFEMVKTVQEVKRSFKKRLRYMVVIWLIISLIAIAVFIYVGYKRLEGRTRCSVDRFFKQYLKNPFKESGEVYKLDEVSQSCVIIQDPKEPKDHTLLSCSTLQMELPRRKESCLAKRMKMLYGALRHTATSPQETLLFYEKVSNKNLCSHFHGQSSSNGKRIRKVIKILLGVLFVLAIGGSIALSAIHFAHNSVSKGLMLLQLSLVAIGYIISKILFRMRKVHYYITDKRVIRVDELPLGLCLTLKSVTFEKIKSVWVPEGNKIRLTLDNESTGIIFEHTVDPTFVVNLIQQRIPSENALNNNNGDVELQEQPQQPTTYIPTTTQN
ncbi:hypothetical protein FDP41_006128 [Naegleria fowleri]|uniref:Uncharacterized protein n=1 Tax=Naegleria fowleri TaxID=5763 RepID=A0A6A5BKS6_NAEFO|nr:uncharacterized protein FDP41_006128 [Naegleria fowleri]KAF0974654.1 hypothetical protein FDP41_006128 [Naegleria fowleri]